MIIQVEGLTITDNGSYVDIDDDFRHLSDLPMSRIRIGKKQASALLRALPAICDKSVGEIEADIGAE